MTFAGNDDGSAAELESSRENKKQQQQQQPPQWTRKPLIRPRADATQHRLPYIGRYQVIEALECYFKVEQSLTIKMLREERKMLDGPQGMEETKEE